MVDHEELDVGATEAKVGTLRRLFGLEYDMPLEGAQITRVHTKNGVEEGYFYLMALDCGLRFPLMGFIVEVLNVYKVAPL